jgi:predicted nucleotidyltransferase
MTGPGVQETASDFAAAPSLEVILGELRAFQPRARAIGVDLVGVVGSVARGEARPGSDIDLVYDAHREGYLWALAGLADELGQRLGSRIDLVDREMMKPELWAWISRDLVTLE